MMEKVCHTKFTAFLVLSFCLQVQGIIAKTLVYGCSNYTFHLEPTTKMVNWEKSRLLCKKLEAGSDLVSIESYEEWNILKNTAQNLNASEYFIGLKNDNHSNGWIWLNNNSSFNASQGKSFWAPGEPSGDGECAVMYKDYNNYCGLFNDLDCRCYDREGYICERPVECTYNKGKNEPSTRSTSTHTVSAPSEVPSVLSTKKHAIDAGTSTTLTKGKPVTVIRKSSVKKANTLRIEATTDKPISVLRKSSVKKSSKGSSVFQILPTTFKKIHSTLPTKKESANNVSTKIYKSQPATLPGSTVRASPPMKDTKGSPYFIVLVIWIIFLVLLVRRHRSNENQRNQLEEPYDLVANPVNAEHLSGEQGNQ